MEQLPLSSVYHKRKREIVALISLPLLYFYIMKLPAIFFLLLLTLTSVFAMLEFYTMYHVKRHFMIFGIVSGSVILWLLYFGLKELQLMLVAIFLIILFLRLLDIERGPENAILDIAPVIIGFFYIPVILGLLILIRDRGGPEWIIFTGGTVWASDSFAYYIGKTFGRKKLYLSVSPGKTIAGTFGSIIGGTIAAMIIKLFLLEHIPFYLSIIFGFIIGGITVIGDLSESMFKRDSGIKDSSCLIPGHGGILDKLDGMLFATPFVYAAIRFLFRM